MGRRALANEEGLGFVSVSNTENECLAKRWFRNQSRIAWRDSTSEASSRAPLTYNRPSYGIGGKRVAKAASLCSRFS
jgi:hypothetical protein